MKNLPQQEVEKTSDLDFITDLYRGLLGRDPDQTGLSCYSKLLQTGGITRVGVIEAIRFSEEFKNTYGSTGCGRSEAMDVFRQFQKFNGLGRTGFVTNFLGGVTDVRFVDGISSFSGVVEDYPLPGNFHGETLEWVGTLKSVLEAKNNYVLFELGAGWGPWCVIGYLAAKQRGIRNVRLVGVEGDATHVQYMQETFAANGIGPDVGKAVYGVVGTSDGEAIFPQAIEGSRMYGAAAAYSEAQKETGDFAQYVDIHAENLRLEKVPCFSLTALIQEFERVDLIHCDIQGNELDLFSAGLGSISDKVKRIVIGTHSFTIETKLPSIFSRNDWELEGITGCRMKEHNGNLVIQADGVQVWRNNRFPISTVD